MDACDVKAAGNLSEYGDKLKEMRDMLAWVWQMFITPFGKSLARRMMALMVFSEGISVLVPLFLSMIVNSVAAGQEDKQSLITGFACFSLAMVALKIVQRYSLRYRELLFGDNQTQLDQVTTREFLNKSMGAHIDENNKLNEGNIKKGYGRIAEMRNILLYEGVESVFSLLLPYIALLFLDRVVFGLVTVMIAIHLAWSLYLNQKTIRECGPIDEKWRYLDRYRIERLDHVERVKANAKETEELKKIRELSEDTIASDRKYWLWFIDQQIIRSMTVFTLFIGVIAYGSYRAWNGEISPGTLFPLFWWTREMTQAIWRISSIEQKLNYATPAIMSLKDALTLPVGIHIPDKPVFLDAGSPCRIVFDGVGFVYNGRSGEAGMKVIDKLSFTIEPGEKVALIGSSGVGKTTTMRLLLKFMDPCSGKITIDGHDIREIDPASWLRQVAYIPQNAQIFDGTIAYNLLYGLSGEQAERYDRDRLWEMARLLQVDFGERLTAGLDTVVGRKGIKLSGGQAQRVMVCAAALKSPRFLVIDEATSSLDATTERLVQEGLEKILTGDRSALIITHRLNTVRRICDKFILLSGNGHGTGIGAQAASFEELARISDEFARLANDQGITL
jgi:ATP-binding cassette, subfamily B, bacterial